VTARPLRRVLSALSDCQWHNLRTVARRCGLSTAGCSARIRDLRKSPFRLIVAVRPGKRAGPYDYRATDAGSVSRALSLLTGPQVAK
jgi:hypothetical protein